MNVCLTDLGHMVAAGHRGWKRSIHLGYRACVLYEYGASDSVNNRASASQLLSEAAHNANMRRSRSVKSGISMYDIPELRPFLREPWFAMPSRGEQWAAHYGVEHVRRAAPWAYQPRPAEQLPTRRWECAACWMRWDGQVAGDCPRCTSADVSLVRTAKGERKAEIR